MDELVFIEKSRNKVAKFETEVRVRRTPIPKTQVPEGRWCREVPLTVMAAYRVEVTFDTQAGSNWADHYYEIETPEGRGVVIDFNSGADLEAFIPKTGKVLVTGCWKKYGRYRGHPVGWLRGNRVNPDSRAKVEHTCHAHIYAIAAGKPWGLR